MKIRHLIYILLFFCISCQNQNNGTRNKLTESEHNYNSLKNSTDSKQDFSSRKEFTVFVYEDLVKITPSPQKKKNLPEGLSYGMLEEVVVHNKLESNMLSQFTSYTNALLLGDLRSTLNYLYDDALVYLRRYFKGMSDEEIAKQFLKGMSDGMVEQIKFWNNRGISFNILVPSLRKKISYKNKVFIVFNVASNISTEKMYMHLSQFDATLAISDDKGRKWKFIAINEDTPNILRISNPEEITDEIMEY